MEVGVVSSSQQIPLPIRVGTARRGPSHPVTPLRPPAPDFQRRRGAHSMLTTTRRESRFPNLVLWILFAGVAVLFGRIIPALF